MDSSLYVYAGVSSRETSDWMCSYKHHKHKDAGHYV